MECGQHHMFGSDRQPVAWCLPPSLSGETLTLRSEDPGIQQLQSVFDSICANPTPNSPKVLSHKWP